MELFASGDDGGPIFLVLLLGGLGYLAYRVYVFFFRPELWAAEQRMKHEKKMATGRIAGGILGGIAKAVIGAAIKGRPHH